MKKYILIILLAIVLILGLVWFFNNSTFKTKGDFKEATYLMEGRQITMSSEGVQYFGNEVHGDFNKDRREDVAFLFTYDGGGSGTFFYVTAALGSEDGYVGTNVTLLGDRIAPQTTEFRDGRIIVNYADRLPGEPMTARPSLGVSKYFEVVGRDLMGVQAK